MRIGFWNYPRPVSAQSRGFALMLVACGTGVVAFGGRADSQMPAAPSSPSQPSAGSPARPDTPLLTSWFTQNSGRYARVVETNGGRPVATWPSSGLPNMGGGQTQPAYSDVQQISYSADYLYIKGTGLASHQMGPWYIGLDRIFGNWPSNLNYNRRFPIHPKPAAKKVTNGLGPLGLWVNGVSLFNLLDGASYDAATGRENHAPPGRANAGQSFWARNAVVVEQPTFDKSNAHQPPSGEYHYHDNPVALRYQLGDNIAFDAKTGNYREDTTKLHHSPILGWSFDGYPIYGPYGYADPNNPAKGVRRMASGFVLRDGDHNTTDLRKTGRHTLAKWAAALHETSAQLQANQSGPDVSNRFTLGRYVEDFDYLGDLGGAQGKDFDLDVCNGRFCVTPDYPKGTYAYFVTIHADGSPAFPYVIGRQWYGVPSGGEMRQVGETVTVYLDAGPKAAIQTELVTTADGKQIKWTSVEGGHYKVEGAKTDESKAAGSQAQAAWTTIGSDVASQGLSTTYKVAAAGYTQFRVTLTTLDKYDTTGMRRGPGGGRSGGPGGRPGGGPGRGPGGPEGPPNGGPGGPGGGPDGPPGPDGGLDGGGPPFGGPGGKPPQGKLGSSVPASATRGTTVTVKFKMGAGIPPPPPDVTPLSAAIGTYRARKVSWDGETITAEFVFPASAASGAQTVTVLFPGPPGIPTVTFTLQKGFTLR